MTAQRRWKAHAQIRRTAVVVLALLGGGGLAACGDAPSPSSDAAARRAAALKIIRQAHAVNPKASSGRIDLTIDLNIKGVPRFAGPIQITANGRYHLAAGASVPDFAFDVAVSLRGGVLGGGLVLVDGKAFVTLGTTGYRIPDPIAKVLVAPAVAARNGLTKTAAMFYVNPQDWQRDAQVTGTTTVAGESVQDIKAGVRLERAFADLARFTHLMTLLHVTQALDLPTELGPKLQAALVRSVTFARGEVWMGTSDHVLRKAHLEGRGVVAPRDRKLLFGATSATLDANVTVSDVGVPQTISAPAQLDSYDSLQLSLSALAEAARRAARAAGR